MDSIEKRLRSLFWMPETGYLPNEILKNRLLWRIALCELPIHKILCPIV